MTRIRLAVPFLTLALLAADGPPDGGWRDGPVRHLLTRAEYDRYGRLKNAEEREEFVARFWRRLDPDPSTPENEFRVRFEALCAEATERFSEGIVPGWRSDRGRILILLGEPDSVRRDAGDARGRDREIWTYSNPPGGRGDPLEIYFYRGSAGQFTLYPEGIRNPVLDTAGRLARREGLRRRLREDNPSLNEYDLDRLVEFLLGPTPGAIAEPSEAEREAKRRSLSGAPSPPDRTEASSVSILPLEEAVYFFQSADRSVLALIAVDFRAEGGPATESGADPEAVAWVSEGGEGGTGRAAIEVPLHPSAHAGGVLFVGKAYLEPGSFSLQIAVADASAKSLYVRTTEITVPEIGDGRLAASSVVPAERFGRVPEGESSAFAVGSEEVVPRPDGAFRRGEPLRLYLQVYDAAVDPALGKPQVDVRFRFERATRNGFRKHGRVLEVRGAEGASMGLALPVGDWPVGEYRVVVELHDRVSGERVPAEGRFRIRE